MTLPLKGPLISDVAFTGLGGVEPEVKNLTIFGSAITEQGLENLSKFTGVETLSLGFTYRDSALKHLASLTTLQVLDLNHNMALQGHTLDQLKGLTNLRILKLENTKIDDSALEHLKVLSNLEELHLIATAITGEGLAHLTELPKLRYLTLSGPNLKGEKMAGLAQLTGLETLILSGPTIDDSCLPYLKPLNELVELHLSRTLMTAVGLDLSALSKLKILRVHDSPVVDAGLKSLVGLRQLNQLDLQDTKITDVALETMMQIEGLCYVFLGGTKFSDKAGQRLLTKSKNMSLLMTRR